MKIYTALIKHDEYDTSAEFTGNFKTLEDALEHLKSIMYRSFTIQDNAQFSYPDNTFAVDENHTLMGNIISTIRGYGRSGGFHSKEYIWTVIEYNLD